MENKPIGYGRFRMVLDNQGLYLDAIILDVNPSFEVYFGTKKQEAVAQGKFQLFGEFHSDRISHWIKKYYKVAFEQSHFIETTHYKPLDRYFEINVSCPAQGEFIILFQDVTDREDSDQMYLDILRKMSDTVFVTDDNGKFTFISPNAIKIFGQTVEECFELENIEHLIGEDYKAAVKNLDKEGTAIQNSEYTIIDKQGDKHDLIINVNRENIGKGTLLFVCQDVTVKNFALKEARVQKERSRAIIDTIPDLIWMKDADGKYVATNKEFELFFGANEDEIIGKSDQELVTDERADVLRKSDLKTMNLGETSTNEETLEYKNDGKVLDFETTKAPFYSAEGNSDSIEGVLGIARDITGTNKIKQELKASKSRFEQLINTANGIIWEANPVTFEITFISKRVDEMLGYTSKQWLSVPSEWKKHIYEKDLERISQRLLAEVKEKNSFEHDYRVVKRDASVIWVREYVSVISDAKGVPTKLVGVVVDVNEEIEDKQNLEKYKRFFNLSQDNFCIANAEGVLLELNPQFPKSLGYEMDELKGTKFLDLVHEDDLQSILDELGKLINGASIINFTNRYKTKSGSIKHFNWNAIPYQGFYYAVARDITTEVEADRQKEESELKYKTLIETAGDAIYVLNNKGITLEVNEAASKMTGYPRHELIGALIGLPNVQQNNEESFMERASLLLHNESLMFESSQIRKDGSQVPLEVIVRAVEQADETLFIIILRDISGRKRDQEEINERELSLIESQSIAKLGSWKLNVEKNELKWTDEVFRIFGEEPQSFLCTVDTFYSYIHPDDKADVQEHWEKCASSGEDYHIKHRIITKQGEIRHVEENGKILHSDNAKLLIARGTIQDITKAVLYQQEQILRDENLHKFFSYIDIGIAKNSMDGKFFDINPEFERFTGYSFDELNEMSSEDLTPENYLEQDAERLKSLTEYGHSGPYKKEFRTKNGDLVPVLIHGVRTMDASGKEFIWSVVQDISETTDYQSRLQQEVEKFKLLLGIGKIIAFEVELETGDVSTVRDSMTIEGATFPIEEITHYDDFFNMIRSEHRPLYQRKMSLLMKGEIDSFSFDFQLVQGHKRYWHQGIITLLEMGAEGTPVKIFVTLRNIDEDKDQEMRNLITQEMERIRISRDIHDSIGQMLVGTRLTLKIKMEDHEGLEEIDELLHAMIKESRMIINNFGISIQESESLKGTFTSLAEKMNRVYDGIITIDWAGSGHVNDLKNATAIFRIYQEALSNAIKYSESPEIHINVRNYDNFDMEVIDWGKGFDSASIEVGFGSINMKERAKEIGANVDVNSSLGNGTVVSLRYDQ